MDKRRNEDMMQLSKMMEGISYDILNGNDDIEVTELVFDSRKVTKGSVFVCIAGAVSDGHSYIADVAEKGAAAVIVDRNVTVPAGVTALRTNDTRNALAYMSAAYFGHPAEKLKIVGITGTKGKTTTSYMVRNTLEAAGIKTGLVGTIETITGKRSIPSANTTPESYLLQQYFAEMVAAGCKCVVMEVSSQGLKQNRVAGFTFDYGVFTNLEPDHISPAEHADFEEYAYCKSLLFQKCRVGIFNADDEHLELVQKGHTCEVETFGISKEADIRAYNIDLHNEGGKLKVEYDTDGLLNMHVEVDIPGKFSVYNSLTAIAICRHFGVSPEVIAKALSTVKVKGRCETVDISDKFTIMVDYAHNAMSLSSLLETMREYEPKRLVCLFGCGGNRSRDRRFEMGEISAKLADFTIITSDNPRFEEPKDIIADIVTGAKRSSDRFVTIVDRKEAIRYAIENAKEGDVIVVAGKGHEDYQEIKGVKHHMDDCELIRDIMAENIMYTDSIAGITGGKKYPADRNIRIRDFCIDSRQADSGMLFVPVIGEKTDGHNYIEQALKDGLSAFFVQEGHVNTEKYKKLLETYEAVMIEVPDTRLALQTFAAYYRKQFSLPVVGITGSVGKTTTKEMVAAALGSEKRVLKTSGNMNSQLGLPLMMLKLSNSYNIAVIEMGMSEFGEMERLSDIACPECAVMTNIGVAHIGQLKTQDNICTEKMKITKHFTSDSVLFANGDDEVISRHTKESGCRIETFGFDTGLDCYAEDVRVEDNKTIFRFNYEKYGIHDEVQLNVIGKHNVLNAMAAICVALHYGVSFEGAKKGLLCYEPISSRGQIESVNDICWIDDTYNASPDSMKSGIEVLLSVEPGKRRIAVLADILELGGDSGKLHYEIGEYISKTKVKDKKVDILVTVGTEAQNIAKGVRDNSGEIKIREFADNDAAIEYLNGEIKKGDVVLVKGSRGMHTEEIIKRCR